ncbi:MAG: Gfo/Idh/MocA family oxidoreductase [Lachnospiraceae bacterium]|nr:Gfo/Idh/MocA family oxidoreductase [Lachnospiraceae bacterium]
MKDIKVGFIGLGGRGQYLLEHVVLKQKEQVTAVCDVYPDRGEDGKRLVLAAGQTEPKVYTDYHDLITDENVNTVVITSAWENHAEAAIASMKAGKATAIEVGGSYSLEQCWDLVKTYEETKTPFMFLENCCYGRREMMVLNMVEQGLFGEIVHCSGGYHHDLRYEVCNGKEIRHYRLRNYLHRNAENYPTHELGPIAKVLKINHGNRMLTLTSTASKSAGLHDYVMRNKPEDELLKDAKFAQGDVVTTVIKCAGGETIVLTLDTSLPRFYSRGFTVRGTRGLYEECTDSVFLDTEEDRRHDGDWIHTRMLNAEEYAKEYDHPRWREYIERGVEEGHGGIDWLEFIDFFEAIRNNTPMPIDVYDAASWMAVTALSEMSIARGGAVVDFPDFTNGKWLMNIID